MPTLVQLPGSVEWILAFWLVLWLVVGGWLIWIGIGEPKFGEIGIAIGVMVMIGGGFVTVATRSVLRRRARPPGFQLVAAILGPLALTGVVILLIGALYGFAWLRETVLGQ
jgi:hypothetical protein